MLEVTSTKTMEEAKRKIELASQRIHAVNRMATLACAVEIGRVVIESLYEGDVTIWRSRGRKDASLRALASHPSLSISASSLYRCLSIYEITTRVGSPLQWHHVGIGHFRAVLSCEPDEQQALLQQAEREAWPASKLKAVSLRSRQRKVTKGGRPRLPNYVKSIHRLERLTEPIALEGLDEVAKLDSGRVRELLDIVERLQERMNLIARVLSQSIPAAARVEPQGRRRVSTPATPSS